MNKNSILLKKDVVLRAHSQRKTDDIHVCADVLAINGCCPRRRREHTSQDRPGKKRNKERRTETILLMFNVQSNGVLLLVCIGSV